MATLKCPRCASARVQRNFGDAPFLLRALGINDLLCNNCNAEFRGFAPPGTTRRSRRHKIELGAGANRKERQRAQRYTVRINVSVGLFDTNFKRSRAKLNSTHQNPQNAMPLVFHEGYTRNLSLIGMAVVLPEARFTDAELRRSGHGGGAHRARLLLHIEPRTLALDATVVRYEQLDEEDALTGWLIAARITRLAGAERERYVHFLRTFDG